MLLFDLLLNLAACRNDNQVNNRKVILLSQQGDASQQQEVCWKDVVAGDLIKVIAGCCTALQH
jgi:magnesium-transporting ATPase (P-type)